MPLLLITATLAWAGARQGATSDACVDGISAARTAHRDHRSAPRAIGVTSLVLIGIPVAFAFLLLVTYGLIFVSHWFT